MHGDKGSRWQVISRSAGGLPEGLVKRWQAAGVEAYLLPDIKLPLVLQNGLSGLSPSQWLESRQDDMDAMLDKFGGVLLRGFLWSRPDEVEAAIEAACGTDWVVYREAATPRSCIGGNLFTSTEYERSESIYVHNENSHVMTWPLRIVFSCAKPAGTRGRTPIADCRDVLANIPSDLCKKFQQLGIMYVRTFGLGLGFDWQDVYKCNSKEALDEYCAENYMVAEWKGETLTVKYKRWATLKHPRTKETVWFNHGAFYNVQSLGEHLQQFASEFGPENMPYNTYFGDGSDISSTELKLIREAYDASTYRFSWQKGDILLLDNMLVAHGRESFVGDREIWVGMCQQMSSAMAKPEDYMLDLADTR